jgi:dipeptidyl-peptidase-4
MGNPEVEDQVLGLSVLANTAWADLSRVGIFGHSYGGFMTLMSMCTAADHFKAGVAAAPVSDWAIYDTHYTERYMGLPEDNADGYRDGNVLTHLDKLTGPLLLIHGMADDNVLFTHSTMLMSELQKRNKPFELMTYPGAKHSMQETHVSVHRFNLILDFFNRNL